MEGTRGRLVDKADACESNARSTVTPPRSANANFSGRIDHALARDLALEAWVLVATREVSEQLEQSLNQKGASIGVPIVILDWKSEGLAELAALCAFAPDLARNLFSPEAGNLAQALQPIITDAVERIGQDLQAWSLGFEFLRGQSVTKLERIWNSPRASNSALGQDAGGGAHAHRIRREAVYEALQAWWNGDARNDTDRDLGGLGRSRQDMGDS